MKTEIFVCVTCQPYDISLDAPRVGVKLFNELIEQVFIKKLLYIVRSIECMGGCSRACTLATQLKGKLRYLFRGLDTTSENASHTLLCAKIHNTNTDGQIPWSESPPLFKKGLIARIPDTLAG